MTGRISRRNFVETIATAAGTGVLAGCTDRIGDVFVPVEESRVTTVTPVDTEVVARLTGADSPNRTAERWNVYGTDLGHTFFHGDDLYMVFGDTFGPGGRGGSDWRSNAMARIARADPTGGLAFEDMITDSDGDAKELLASKKTDGEEITVIPTYGVSDGSRMYLHYMSVRTWGSPGRWEVNHAGLAYSDDDGRTWIEDPDATWPGDSNFVQVAIVERDGDRYFFGIPAGRFGGAALARTGEDPLRLNEYEYWDGSSWVAGDASAATTIVPAPVGELSVRWSSHHRRWLMMYLDENRRAVVLRTAERLTGPWGDERVVVTTDEHPQLYAPYVIPEIDAGPDVYFTMSRFDVYNVLLVRTTLRIDDETSR